MPKWLKDAVFYEIYPQSFYDSNGDGIGDINGIIEKLDYVKNLGCNAIWLNPVYDSPFKDAGYDVRNYKKVAPRYGTNADLVNLLNAAHKKKIRIILDLVPGHTSDTHPWFKQSRQAKENKFSPGPETVLAGSVERRGSEQGGQDFSSAGQILDGPSRLPGYR